MNDDKVKSLDEKRREVEAKNQEHEELKVYEKAARILCAKRGRDPDEKIQVPSAVLGVARYEPLWKAAATELIAFSECLVALREGMTPQASKQ